MRPESLLVIGLGPAGGSMAWTAVRSGVPRVVGYSSERRDAVQAVSASVVHELADRLEPAVRAADLIIVAPSAGGGEILGRIAPHLAPAAFATSVVDLARPAALLALSAGLGPRWAASHPLRSAAGEGFAAARPELFRGAVVYVTPAAAAEGAGAASVATAFGANGLAAASWGSEAAR